MAILKEVEIHFCKLDPKRPSNKFNKKNPTWECQIRTSDKNVKKAWEELKLPVKAIVPDEGNPYWRVNLRKKSIKEDGEPASPIKVVDGKMDPVNPNSIGNGSIANVRIFQYEYPKEGGGIGIASVLMGVQLLKHIVYHPKARDEDFEEADTEVIDNAENEAESEESNEEVF